MIININDIENNSNYNYIIDDKINNIILMIIIIKIMMKIIKV